MNKRLLFSIYLLLFPIIFCCNPVNAQVVIERSKDKVVISGITYYIHTVKKGETIYSISRAYGITPEVLVRENQSISGGLKEGQGVRIPEKLVTDPPLIPEKQVPVIPRDESKYFYHKLQPGETVYSLSKKYEVSETDIVRGNPGIDITHLPLGFEVAIPRKASVVKSEPVTVQETVPFYHKVVKGETLSSISRFYDISLRDLRRENRDVGFPQVGDSLRIPGKFVTVDVKVEEHEADTIPEPGMEEMLYRERPSQYTTVRNLSGSFNVAVLLPFYLYENAKRTEIDSSRIVKGKRIYTEINRAPDWIFPGSQGFLEMYEGILLAADTLRALGLDINLYVSDVRGDSETVDRLLRSGRLDNMDLIIGPVYSGNLSTVASYAGRRGIPVVSPVQLYNNEVLNGNQNLFLASSGLEVAQRAIAREISSNPDQNIIFIHTDTAGNDPEVNRFRDMICSEMGVGDSAKIANFRDLIFYSRSVFGLDSVGRLPKYLSENRKNIIVIASEDAPMIIETIQDIHSLSRKFDITVVGYPELRRLVNIDPKFLFETGLTVYSPYWLDYSSPDVKRFCSSFFEKFRTQPSETSYAWEGYDITYFFLSGLAIHGKDFLTHPEIHNPDLLYTGFDFRRWSLNNGFEDHKLFLIRYKGNYDLELVRDTTIFNLR